MCSTCDKAKKLDSSAALKLLAGTMQTRRNAGKPTDCLDRTVGEVIGFDEDGRDLDTEALWEDERR
jgi:hypothetical protein